NVKGQVLMAQASAGLKEFDTAISDLELAIASMPGEVGLRLTLGEILFAANKKPEAEQAFRDAVTGSPRSGEAHLQLGKFLWSAGQLPEAEQELLSAVTEEPR